MDIQDVFKEARYHHVRKVLQALGPDRVAKAMTAFENGASSWSECFFARALKDEVDLTNYITLPLDIQKRRISNPEYQIMQALGIETVVPIRLVWHAFDSHGMTRKQLQAMIDEILDDQPSKETLDFINSIDFDQYETKELTCGVPVTQEPEVVKWPNTNSRVRNNA